MSNPFYAYNTSHRYDKRCRQSRLQTSLKRLAPISVVMITLLSVIFFINLAFANTGNQYVLTQQDTRCSVKSRGGCYGGASDADVTKNWNILYHLGGNGPWIPKVDDVVEGGIEVPRGCEVDMVHMISRHGERYPTVSAGARMLQVLNRIKSLREPLIGSLAFLNNYTYFAENPEAEFEQLVTTGPYAGTLEAFTTGVKLSTRYRHLRFFNDSMPPTYVWAADADRVIDTARYFSAGFFGLESRYAKVVIVPETDDRGGNTLTPGETCPLYRSDLKKGHENGYTQLYAFRKTYLPAISKRLKKENPNVEFSVEDLFSMQELCGFETLARGSSPLCDIFTHDEWRSFEYARDVIHYYRSGPGTPYSRAMGMLWLDATTKLLLDGPEKAGSLYFSFVHDGDIVPMLAALGLFEDPKDLPVDGVWEGRRWKTSQITPMGGRIIFERMTCGKGTDLEKFVRVNVNDGIVELKGCSNGPGKSCRLGAFAGYIKARGKKAGTFKEVCGITDDVPLKLKFLRQPGFGGHKQ